MANMTSITAVVRAEDPSIFVPTSTSKQFTCLLVNLVATGEAERALGQYVTANRKSVTPVMLAFDAVLIAVRAYILAERELDGADAWDPACRNWRDDADAARALLESRIVSMRGMRPVLPGDRLLLRMSLLVGIMLRTTTRCDLARAHGVLTTHAMMFECADSDPVAARVNALLRRGRSLIDSLAALPAYVDAEGDFVLGFGDDENLPDSYAPDDLIEAA